MYFDKQMEEERTKLPRVPFQSTDSLLIPILCWPSFHVNQWLFIRRRHHMFSCLPSCSSDLFIFSLAGLTHLTVIVMFKVSKARLVFEELMYWFVKTRAIR